MAGVKYLAITDHDNDQAFKTIAREKGLCGARDLNVHGLILVSGVELSCRWQNTDVHVVALNYHSGSQTMESLLGMQAQNRARRNLEIRDKLMAAGVNLAFDELDSPDLCCRLGRVYFAEKMVEAGIVKNSERAFKRYLGKSGRAHVKSSWIAMEDAIEAARAAGGSVILAHPLKYRMSRGKLRKLAQQFAEMGGDALEVTSGRQVNTETERAVNLAEECGLQASIGSDFHAPGRPWSALGVAGYLPKRCRPVWQAWDNLDPQARA